MIGRSRLRLFPFNESQLPRCTLHTIELGLLCQFRVSRCQAAIWI